MQTSHNSPADPNGSSAQARPVAPTTLRVTLLGSLSLAIGDQLLPPLSPPKLKSLLACLLLHRSQPIPRDQLAEWLWPQQDFDEARANLRRHLHLLRQALPPGDWLITERESVQWNPAADFWLDVDEFCRLATECLSCSADPPCEACLALYQGDLLPELYDDWLISHRERLSQLFAQALQAASEYYSQRGRYADAIHYARRLLLHDPLREEIHRLLMRLYALSGDRQAALRQFDECQQALRRELNVAPMPATLELQQAILEDRLKANTPPPADRWHLPPAASPPPLPKHPARQRWRWLVLAGIVILAGITAMALILALPRRPASVKVQTLALSSPAWVEDTWISEAFPDELYWADDPELTPYHRYTRAHLQFYDPRALDRILVRFDLSKLPPQADLISATFTIHLETWLEAETSKPVTRSFPAEVGVFQVLNPWLVEEATFNHASAGQPWAAPGLQPGSDRQVNPLAICKIDGTTWLSFDVLQAVRQWQRQPQTNHGLVVQIISAPEGLAHYWVDLTEQPNPNLRPALMITYRQP